MFSQRIGITPIEKLVQLRPIDDDLRNTLWSLLTAYYWDKFNRRKYSEFGERGDHISGSNLGGLFTSLWVHYFKKPIDSIPEYFWVYSVSCGTASAPQLLPQSPSGAPTPSLHPRAGKSSPPDVRGSRPQTAATSPKPCSVLAVRADHSRAQRVRRVSTRNDIDPYFYDSGGGLKTLRDFYSSQKGWTMAWPNKKMQPTQKTLRVFRSADFKRYE